MTARIRLAMAILVAGLALGTAPARAQDAAAPPPETTNQTVGPRELQNFNLEGTVTRRAEPPPPATNPAQPATRPPATRPATEPATRTTRPSADAIPARRTPTASAQPEQRTAPERRPPTTNAQPSSSITAALPPVGDSPSGSTFDTNPVSAPAIPAPTSNIPLPWLLVAGLLVAGAGAYFWRHRRREALAGAGDEAFDSAPEAYPEPAPQPARPLQRVARVPAPTPRPDLAPRPDPAPQPDPIGIVSTRLRPWLEIAFKPTKCIIDDENVTFEFELGLFNSGSTPARAILVEASYFNAGADQDKAIEQFYANPVGEGGRAVSLGPLKTMVIATKVVTPRAQVREYEAGGRKVFVPLIGFNALYSWATGEGQTSASFILGRATSGEKLAPFRLDMEAREFRTLGQRPLPVALRQ